MSKLKLEGGGLDRFKEIIEDFVDLNFYVDGLCPRCSDNCLTIMPLDFTKKDKEKYNLAIKKLFEVLQ